MYTPGVLGVATVTAHPAHEAPAMISLVLPSYVIWLCASELRLAVVACLLEYGAVVRTVVLVMVDEVVVPLQLAVALAALEVLDVPIAAPVLPVPTKDRLVAHRAAAHFDLRETPGAAEALVERGEVTWVERRVALVAKEARLVISLPPVWHNNFGLRRKNRKPAAAAYRNRFRHPSAVKAVQLATEQSACRRSKLLAALRANAAGRVVAVPRRHYEIALDVPVAPLARLQ